MFSQATEMVDSVRPAKLQMNRKSKLLGTTSACHFSFMLNFFSEQIVANWTCLLSIEHPREQSNSISTKWLFCLPDFQTMFELSCVFLVVMIFSLAAIDSRKTPSLASTGSNQKLAIFNNKYSRCCSCLDCCPCPGVGGKWLLWQSIRLLDQ